MLDLSKLSKGQLIGCVKMLLSNLTTMDGLWFTQVEDKFGLDVALEIDMLVWKRYGPLESRRIRDRMAINEAGLDGLSKALPFSSFVAEGFDPNIERDGDRLVFTIADCRVQRARIRNGRGEFPCKAVAIEYFQEFAKGFGTDIRTRCLVCPPDEHPDDVWCAWEFVTHQEF